MRKLCLLYIGCLLLTVARAQSDTGRYYKKEFSFTTENDAYLFQQKDAFYTNGFLFNLRTALNRKGHKVISGFQLGQMIYTPLIRKTSGPKDIDRPYAGYLFLKYDHTRFYPGDAVFQYKLGVGQVGNASFGEDVQNWYHSLLGYGKFTGWQYQVKDAFGADAGITYAKTLLQDSSWIKLMPVAQFDLGMNFTNAKAGAYLVLGSFENNGNSALWNARVQSQKTMTRRKYELFLYWYPQVIWQGYNSTVQGGLAAKGTGAILKETAPWMFEQTFGVCYAEKRWTTNVGIIYQSKEAVTQKTPQRYVSAQVSYRFR